MQHENIRKASKVYRLNDDGLQTCLNTTFTQDCKKKNTLGTFNMETEAFIIKPYNNQANYIQNMYMQRNITLITKCNACK